MLKAQTQIDLVRMNDGASGKSAYELWLEAGNTGTLEEYLESLNGTDGKGIQSIAITYQIHSNGTTEPTGTWEPTPPPTTPEKPYMWTKAVITYTDNNTSTMYSVGATPEGVQANIDAVDARVTTAQTTANSANNKIDNLAIGGRNLLLNSDFKKTTTASGETSMHHNLYPVGYNGYNSGITNPTINYHAHIDNDTFGFNVCEFNESNGNRNWKGIIPYIKIEETGEYTFSCDIYATGSGTQIWTGIYGRHKETNNFQFHSNMGYIYPDEINKWKRYSCTVSLNNTIDFSESIMLYIYGFYFTTNSVVYIKNVKLEKGNKATDWTPAPEDVDEQIETLETDVATDLASVEESCNDALSTAIKDTNDRIEEKASTLETVKTTVNGLTATFNTTVTQVGDHANILKKYQDHVIIADGKVKIQNTANQLNSVFSNTDLQFRNGEAAMATFSVDGVDVESVVTKRTKYFGNWAVQEGKEFEAGKKNLNDVWIGG